MKEHQIEERVRMLEKEMVTLTQQVDRLRFDLREQNDAAKIELAATKTLLSDLLPEFKIRFASVKQKISKKIDPETLIL